MLASCARQGSIEVYSFEPKPTSTTGMGSTCSSHVASLALPELQDDIGVAILSTHTGPFYARCPPGKAFTTSPDSRISRIHAVSVQYFGIRDFHPRYCFFVHNRTLLSYVDMDRAPGNVIRVPWEEWGTDHTRFLPHHTPFQWLRYPFQRAI
jgi:hypothetical protein